MNNIAVQLILRFLALVLLQVLVLDNIELHQLVKPVIYPLFILLLPISFPSWMVMLIAMGLGLTIDAFNNTIGIHASACVFMAFCRPLLLKANTPRGGYEQSSVPSVEQFGLTGFLIYAGILILLFHTFFYFVEAFGFRFISNTILKIIISSFLSLLLILVHQMLFQKRK